MARLLAALNTASGLGKAGRGMAGLQVGNGTRCAGAGASSQDSR
jgi:hypothetical protein